MILLGTVKQTQITDGLIKASLMQWPHILAVIMARMNNHIQKFTLDVITYPCNNPDAGLANVCYLMGLLLIEPTTFEWQI